jgi:malic enzyme
VRTTPASKIYTPGVATVCRRSREPDFAWLYTAIPHLVAIVTNEPRLGWEHARGLHARQEGKAALLSQSRVSASRSS